MKRVMFAVVTYRTSQNIHKQSPYPRQIDIAQNCVELTFFDLILQVQYSPHFSTAAGK
ncbi:hypothetical protein BH23CYA1_BH23CYA1_14800 [soil metagenome]